MTIDRATIINWALTDIGAGPMFSVDDDSDQAEQIENVWQAVVDFTFGLHDWSWCRKTFKNRRLTEKPENGFAYAFELPGGRIGNPLRYWDQPRARTPIRDFELEAGLFFCDYAETWSLCKTYVDPDYWPTDWRAAFKIALGGALAVPVWQDKDLRADLFQEAFGSASMQLTGGMFGRLMAQDKASNPIGDNQSLDNPLTNARYESGAGLSWHGRW